MTGNVISFGIKAVLICTLLLTVLGCGVQSEGGSSVKEDPRVVRIAETMVDLSVPGLGWGGDVALVSGLYDWLVKFDQNGVLIPELALSWDTEDGKTWTVTLRQGVLFHDGSRFDADDLIYTVERTQDPELGHVERNTFAVVDSIEKVDAYTVRFHLGEAYPTFMYLFTSYNMEMLSSDYDYTGMGVTRHMGTGPFMTGEISVGEGAVLDRNGNYWREGYPKVDQLRFYFVNDMETRMNMLSSGKADIVRDMAVVNLDRIKDDPALTWVVPYQGFRIVYMNRQMSPFDDYRVVEALKYCVDPAEIALACQGTYGEDLFFSESHIAFSQREYLEMAPRQRDIEKAKALLTEAGYPDGVDVDIFYESDIDFGTAIALTLKELSAPAGFRINLKGNPRDIYISQFWMKSAFGITNWNPRVDPSIIFRLAYRSDGIWNESGMKSPKADGLIDLIVNELDDEKRMELYKDLQIWFHEQGPVLNVQVPFIVAMNRRIKAYREPMSRIIDFEELFVD